jgi:cysteine-rich repeat protein
MVGVSVLGGLAMRLQLLFGCSVSVLMVVACSGSPSIEGSGGSTSAGGASGTGGSIALGGATHTGGSPAAGGSSAVGGTSSIGGTTSTAGATSTGGTIATGGTSSLGGSTTNTGGTTTSTGGTAATGGTIATGGTTTTGGTSNTSTGGALPTGGAGPTGGTAPDCSGSQPAVGCPCTTTNLLACSSVSRKVRLKCNGTVWVNNTPTCDSNNNCSEVDGLCHPIIPECQTASTYCDPTAMDHDVVLTCSADLTSTTASPACNGVCVSGACVTPRCGDGKVQAAYGEECDDTNAIPIDGCENDCTKSKVIDMGVGNGFTCALLRGGYVRCWGDNTYNQLGLGHADPRSNLKPYQLTKADGVTLAGPIDLGGTATAIAVGTRHACALLSTGKVKCWGDNSSGQLGQGNTDQILDRAPNAINGVQFDAAGTMTAKAIAAGGRSNCAILQDDSVRCWGVNSNGELGLGNKTAVSAVTTPAGYLSVSLGATAVGIATSSDHSCAILSDSTARCWGGNSYGELGISNTTPVGATQVPSSLGAAGLLPTGAVGVKTISTATLFSCALLNNYSIECWGQNTYGQIGIGSAANVGDNESPAAYGMSIIGNVQATCVVAGTGHTCALLTGQGLKCWGSNIKGELGDGTTTNHGVTDLPASLPIVAVGASLGVKSVWAGANQTCVVLTDESVRCWGWNDRGQLGTGSVSSTPNDYIGGTDDTTPDKLAPIQIFGP